MYSCVNFPYLAELSLSIEAKKRNPTVNFSRPNSYAHSSLNRDARDHDRPIIRSISLSFVSKISGSRFRAMPRCTDSAVDGLTRRSVKRARTSVSGGISPDHFHLIDRPETLARICAPWIEGDTGTAISMGTDRAN